MSLSTFGLQTVPGVLTTVQTTTAASTFLFHPFLSFVLPSQPVNMKPAHALMLLALPLASLAQVWCYSVCTKN